MRVDLADVQAVTAVRTLKESRSRDSRPTPVERPSDTRTLAALQEHVETLRGELARERERSGRDAETLRETVGAIKAALAAERELRETLREELALARRPWWRRLVG